MAYVGEPSDLSAGVAGRTGFDVSKILGERLLTWLRDRVASRLRNNQISHGNNPGEYLLAEMTRLIASFQYDLRHLFPQAAGCCRRRAYRPRPCSVDHEVICHSPSQNL